MECPNLPGESTDSYLACMELSRRVEQFPIPALAIPKNKAAKLMIRDQYMFARVMFSKPV